MKKNFQIQVKVSFEFYSEQESFNTIAGVCVYAGVQNPEVEEDFDILGPANEVAGWKKTYLHNDSQYGFQRRSVGCFGIRVLWESYLTYYIDDVEIEIYWAT